MPAPDERNRRALRLPENRSFPSSESAGEGGCARDAPTVSRRPLETEVDGPRTRGVGFQFRPTDKTAFYGELERSTGGEVKDHYTFNVGARYAW